MAGWRKTTDAAHAQGGAIFAQLMHVGRIGHPLNVPEGGELVAPSAIAAAGDMYTDQQGPQPASKPGHARDPAEKYAQQKDQQYRDGHRCVKGRYRQLDTGIGEE